MESKNPLLDRFSEARLIWIERAGVGYFECAGQPYDQAYFDRYAAQADTGIGPALNLFRCQLASAELYEVGKDAEHRPELLDVGIGDGAFLREAARLGVTFERFLKGYDVNPAGVEYLETRNQFGDLYARQWPVVTFWDSLEHIRSPELALAQVSATAIVSIPIFNDVEHVMRSRHYRPDEHYWYFTRAGFVAFADQCGFDVADIRATETALGRDGIETFVLRRRPVAVG